MSCEVALTFFILFFVTAPYGRHNKKMGFMMSGKWGWIIQEIISPLTFAHFFIRGDSVKTPEMWVFFALWMGHYFNRSVIFPFRQKYAKDTAVIVVFSAIFFNIINGFEELKNMSILKSGRIFPLVLEGQENIEPEWLSSCLMFHKDAIDKQPITSLENNNTEGKAYYEDVFFTFSLKKKGFRLILDEDITLTHPYTTSIKPRAYINTIFRQKKFTTLSSR